jgi:hypothetical protein
LIRGIVGIQQYRHDRHKPVAHEALVDEAPRVAERAVSRLSAHVRDVEVVGPRQRLDQVPREGRVDGKRPVGAIAIPTPVRQPAQRREGLDRRRQILDRLSPVDAESGLIVGGEPLGLIVADHDQRVEGFLHQRRRELADRGLRCLVPRPEDIRTELAADP